MKYDSFFTNALKLAMNCIASFEIRMIQRVDFYACRVLDRLQKESHSLENDIRSISLLFRERRLHNWFQPVAKKDSNLDVAMSMHLFYHFLVACRAERWRTNSCVSQNGLFVSSSMIALVCHQRLAVQLLMPARVDHWSFIQHELNNMRDIC